MDGDVLKPADCASLQESTSSSSTFKDLEENNETIDLQGNDSQCQLPQQPPTEEEEPQQNATHSNNNNQISVSETASITSTESGTNSESATIDTESADDTAAAGTDHQMETVELNNHADLAPNVVPQMRLPNDDLLSLQSYGSESTLSSDHSGRRPKYMPADSSEEDDLLSELESELVNGLSNKQQKELVNSLNVSSKPNRRKKSASPDDEFYRIQLDVLQQNIASLHQDLAVQKATQAKSEIEHKEMLNQCKADYVSKLEKLVKQCEAAKRDKESMVVRYAQSEKEVIILKKNKEDLDRKLNELMRDREGLNGKIRVLHADRVRACSSLDNKMAELAHNQRDSEKLREEVHSRDIKIKWAQNKLKTEIDSHKETQSKLDQTNHRLQEMREESEQLRRDCQEMIRRYQESEEIKSVSLDIQLKEKLSELEIQKQERFDQEEVFGLLRQELDALKKRQKSSVEENNALTVKIQTLERERLEYEQTLSKLKDSQSGLRQEVADLNTRLSEMENLDMQLDRERERVLAAQKEAERIRMSNLELQADMDACHVKEGELLEFTERLTAKSMQLQSEHSLLEVKAQSLEEEAAIQSKRVEELESMGIQLQERLDTEKKLRLEETQILARKLAEKTKFCENLNVKLDEATNENRVMKRRHLTSIKELSRELYHTKKRLDAFESPSASSTGAGDTASLGSRTSSSGSLDTMAANGPNNLLVNGNQSCRNMPSLAPQVGFSGSRSSVAVSPLAKDSHQPPTPTSCSQNSNAAGGIQTTQQSNNNINASNTQGVEIDRQVLIERIIRLQKVLARKNEKVEFLEEHVAQLITEIKKKSRIIQNYILREESGALIPCSMDQNKAELSRHKGTIMGSVYQSQLSDNRLTLELSLEINQKLQAVLEDTLLKNITLKENINTLGEEIARISKEQHDLQASLRTGANKT